MGTVQPSSVAEQCSPAVRMWLLLDVPMRVILE